MHAIIDMNKGSLFCIMLYEFPVCLLSPSKSLKFRDCSRLFQMLSGQWTLSYVLDFANSIKNSLLLLSMKWFAISLPKWFSDLASPPHKYSKHIAQTVSSYFCSLDSGNDLSYWTHNQYTTSKNHISFSSVVLFFS